MALLGTACVNDPQARDESGGAVKLKFEDLKERVTHPKSNWWESLDEAGEQIGWHWRELARQVDTLTDKANRGTLAAARPMLARADYLARLADSATLLGKDRDPVLDYRRHSLHRFLLDQAKRSIDANWAAADLAAVAANKPSFAKETAARFVDDAERLIMMGADKDPTPEDRTRLSAEVNPAKQALAIQDYSVTPDEPSIELTDRRNFRVGFKIKPPGGQPVGYPVLRYVTGGPCKLPTDVTSGRRPITDYVDFQRPVRNETQDAEVDLTAVSKSSGVIEAEVWYRGHRFIGKSTITVNKDPSSIWVYKPPQGDPGFKVIAGPEFRKGAVAIALDWSKSMNNNNKYYQAMDALEAVLQSLPPGTVVSVLQFGDPDPNFPEPTWIYRGPVAYDYERRPEEVATLIRDLRLNKPRGDNSPIARTIVELTRNGKGFRNGFAGFKTVLVLTDGMDNVDGENAGNKVFNELASKKIAVKMCFFQAVGNEERARAFNSTRFEALTRPANSIRPPTSNS